MTLGAGAFTEGGLALALLRCTRRLRQQVSLGSSTFRRSAAPSSLLLHLLGSVESFQPSSLVELSNPSPQLPARLKTANRGWRRPLEDLQAARRKG